MAAGRHALGSRCFLSTTRQNKRRPACIGNGRDVAAAYATAKTQANIGDSTTETNTDLAAIQTRTMEAVATALSTSEQWGPGKSENTVRAVQEKVAVAIAKALACSLQKIVGSSADCKATVDVVRVLQRRDFQLLDLDCIWVAYNAVSLMALDSYRTELGGMRFFVLSQWTGGLQNACQSNVADFCQGVSEDADVKLCATAGCLTRPGSCSN